MSLGQLVIVCLTILLSSKVAALELVSLRDDGPRITQRPNDVVFGGYTGQSLSADGRYFVVQSRATNLVAEHSATDVDQIYVYDFLLQKYERVSVTAAGQPGSSASWSPTISADGRVVFFSTRAVNLLGAVPPGNYGQLVSKDLVTGDLQIISRSPVGEFSESYLWRPKPSANGRWVAFQTSARNLIANDDARFTEVYLHDRLTANTRRLTSSSVHSLHSSNIQDISDGGDYVLFSSTFPAHYEGDSEESTVLTSSDLFRLKVSDGTVVPV